jgi:hypothetical protein
MESKSRSRCIARARACGQLDGRETTIVSLLTRR